MSASRIMLVNAPGVSREIVVRVLKEYLPKVELTLCTNGAEALTKLAEQPHSIIAVAQTLPDMAGTALCQDIRKTDHHCHVPVLLITNQFDETIHREAFNAGVTDLIDKRRGYKALGEFVREILMRNEGRVGNVLYIEDSMTAAMMVKRSFKKHGIQVTHTKTGEDAERILATAIEEGKQPFDIIVSDFFLETEMTGGDLLRRVRQKYHLSAQDMPFLILTGNDDAKTTTDLFYVGANDFLTKPISDENLMAKVRSLLLLRQQHDALRKQSARVAQNASIDPVTGVYNRDFLARQGDQYLQTRKDQPVWTLILDLDNFATINNKKGPTVADHMLATIGSLLMKSFPGGVVARLGGVKFAILQSIKGRMEALSLAESLRQRIQSIKVDGVSTTISIGIAGSAEHQGTDLNKLLALANRAMLAAKESGQNRVCIIDGQNRITALKPQPARTA